MPGKDGLEVIKDVIAYDYAAILLVTARDDQKIISQGLASSATSYISKPFDFKCVKIN